MRSLILEWTSVLLEDKAADDAHRRQQEAAAKAQASEIAKTAPKIKLMKLDGYQTWFSWSYQAKELLAGLSNEQAKVALIYESLSVNEDKQHLKGLTSLSECNKYLIQKYNRPYEIISSILAKGTRMQAPGNDNKISKYNCLTMLEIRRYL